MVRYMRWIRVAASTSASVAPSSKSAASSSSSSEASGSVVEDLLADVDVRVLDFRLAFAFKLAGAVAECFDSTSRLLAASEPD